MDVDKIFDTFLAFSDKVHRADEIRKLSQRVHAPKKCGDCDKWMKSRECPKEKNVNGYSRGPSMEGIICEEFVETDWSIKHREQLSQDLERLKQTPLTP